MPSILDIEFSYSGSNPKFNPVHGQKLFSEPISDLFLPEISAILSSPQTISVSLIAAPNDGFEVFSWLATEPIPIPGIPSSTILGKIKLTTLEELIAQGFGKISETGSLTFSLQPIPVASVPPVEAVASETTPQAVPTTTQETT